MTPLIRRVVRLSRASPAIIGAANWFAAPFVRWRRVGVWDQIMDALSAGHDPAVQMIDTSVVRVHQHGACISDTTITRIWVAHEGA